MQLRLRQPHAAASLQHSTCGWHSALGAHYHYQTLTRWMLKPSFAMQQAQVSNSEADMAIRSYLEARRCSWASDRPTQQRPSSTAQVAGTAPSERTTASTACAVSRFWGKGMPCAMMVLSNATTGLPCCRAAATSGDRDIAGCTCRTAGFRWLQVAWCRQKVSGQSCGQIEGDASALFKLRLAMLQGGCNLWGQGYRWVHLRYSWS